MTRMPDTLDMKAVSALAMASGRTTRAIPVLPPELVRELRALRVELAAASTREEVDRLIEQREHLFKRLRPGGRKVLFEILGRRLAELPGALNGPRDERQH
jgi:hypothetical protein